MATAFVYGTLMFPEALQALLGRVPELAPASVAGFVRRALKGEPYPGVVRAGPGDEVSGLVLLGLTPDEMSLLDAFEGDEYNKIRVGVRLAGSSSSGQDAPSPDSVSLEADMYLFLDAGRLAERAWDAEAFRESALGRWVSDCEAWRLEYESDRRARREFAKDA